MTTPAQLPVHCGWKEIQFNSRSVYMKKTIFNGAVLLSVLLCFSLVLFAACDTGTSGDSDDTETPIENPVDDPADDPASAPAPKLDFESANIATLKTNGAIAPSMNNLNATWNPNPLAEGEQFTDQAVTDMVMEAVATEHDSGSACLGVTATAYQNFYARNVAQWMFQINLGGAGLGETVDLTDKTVSIKAFVPEGSKIEAIKLVFGHDGQESQGKQVRFDEGDGHQPKDTWTTVSYKYVNKEEINTDYTSGDFDIGKVKTITVIALIDSGTANVPGQTVYLDSLDW